MQQSRLKTSGHEQQKAKEKAAAIQKHTKEAKEILQQCQQAGVTPELKEKGQQLLKTIQQLIQEETVAQETLTNLSQKHGHDNTPELQQHIDQRLEELQKNLQQLEEAQESLTQVSDLVEEDNEEAEDPIQAAAFKNLANNFNNPQDAPELTDNAQQQVRNLLDRMRMKGKTPTLQQEAKVLREGLASLVKRFQSQDKAINDVYFGDDTSDFANQGVGQAATDSRTLRQGVKATKQSLDELCKAFDLTQPDLKPEPPISKEALIKGINFALDNLVPAGDLVKIVLGTADAPQTLEEFLQLAVSTTLDFIPGGKGLKLFKGAATKLGIKKIESQLLKQAEKRVAKAANAAKKAGKIASHVLQKIQLILKPGGKVIGKQLGNDPTIRTIGKEEAEKIIKQLMDAGAKKANNSRYRGTWYVLPGGGGFGVRTKASAKSLKHGTPNTIDLYDLELEEINKLKY